MRPVKWLGRLFALVQLLLIMPPLTSGSMCISADGVERLESECCPCMALPASGAEATLAGIGTTGCGPCRDEVFTALKGIAPSDRHVSMAPIPVLTPRVSAPVSHLLECPLFRAGEPPGSRLPILRC